MILISQFLNKHLTEKQTFFFAAGLAFSRKHPLSLWLSSMLVIFSGSVVANALMGEPILTPFKNNNAIFLATAVW